VLFAFTDLRGIFARSHAAQVSLDRVDIGTGFDAHGQVQCTDILHSDAELAIYCAMICVETFSFDC